MNPCPVQVDRKTISDPSAGFSVGGGIRGATKMPTHSPIRWNVAYRPNVAYRHAKFKDLNLGLVDGTVAALAERRQICRVLTTDRRDFSAIRIGPRLSRALELLPL